MQIRCLKCMGSFDDSFEICPHCGHIKSDVGHEAYHLTPGTILNNRYLIGCAVGFGGFGITYIAYDTVLDIKTAIKEFYPAGLVNRSPGTQAVGVFSGEKQEEYNQLKNRFILEAQNMARFCNEPDIVNVFDFFEANGTAYIIMEYIDGILLKTYMRENKPFAEADAVSIITPILTALNKIHKAGIIHRDISPDNIFLLPGGAIKIFDFGVARFDKNEEDQQPAIVKAGYAPPEQYRSRSKQDYCIDIYAVGAILYEMITGEKPLDSSDRSAKDELQRPSKLGFEVSSHVEKAIMKAMALKPEIRFQNVDAFRKALGNLSNIDYPEEEIRKIKLRRRIVGGAAGAGTAIILLLMVLRFTVWKPPETIVDRYLDLEPTTVEVWLLEEDKQQKKANQKIVDKFEKSYPTIDVVYEGITSEKLKKEMENGAKLPDFYPVPEDKVEMMADKSADLDLLYRANRDSVKYPDEMPQTVMPVSFTIDVMYVNTKAAAKKNMKLADIPESFDRDKVTADHAAYALYSAKNCKRFRDSKIIYLYGSSNHIQNIHKISAGYNISKPVLTDGKLVKSFHDYYGVNAGSAEAEQTAAMWFLYWMSSDYASNIRYIQNGENIPLCSMTFNKYIETYPDFEFLNDYE